MIKHTDNTYGENEWVKAMNFDIIRIKLCPLLSDKKGIYSKVIKDIYSMQKYKTVITNVVTH